MNLIKKIQKALRETNVARFVGKLSAMRRQISQLLENFAVAQQRHIELRSDFATLCQQIKAFQDDFAVAQHQISNGLKEMEVARKGLLGVRYHSCGRPNEGVPLEAKGKKGCQMSEQFHKLKGMAGQAYAVWRELLEVNERNYKGFPIDSCSVDGHSMATLFRFFLAPYLRGRVLDIGCGPQPVPVYLEDHPVEALYGIDPLGEPGDHPFHFHKGLAEFLPWEDGQFSMVVAATSLDHVLLPDRVLAEVRRVLSRDGVFVVWVSFIPGSEAYDPYQKKIEKIDDYHLFHFDREWFLKTIEPFFTVFEEFTFARPEMSCFLALRPRKQDMNSKF